MIFYNFRYRGPYEYDKYVLNVFQYSNMVNDFINDINNTATWKTLYDLNNEVDSIYNKTIGDGGRSDVIYETLILNIGE